MTLKELNDKLDDLHQRYLTDRHDLSMQYALEHNPYKVGDIVKDNCGKIKIETIGLWISDRWGIPTCVYSGPELRVDNTPKKNGAKRQVFQTNIK